MPYEMKNNSGSLFANDRREKDTHPNAKGTCLIDGREFYISAWTKTSANGKRWQSLSFQLKEQQAAQSNPPASGFDDIESEVPF